MNAKAPHTTRPFLFPKSKQMSLDIFHQSPASIPQCIRKRDCGAKHHVLFGGLSPSFRIHRSSTVPKPLLGCTELIRRLTHVHHTKPHSLNSIISCMKKHDWRIILLPTPVLGTSCTSGNDSTCQVSFGRSTTTLLDSTEWCLPTSAQVTA